MQTKRQSNLDFLAQDSRQQETDQE